MEFPSKLDFELNDFPSEFQLGLELIDLFSFKVRF